jgi:protein tyrosine phosphatase (PTP) superfamily phosphohydrolase (DUF442 family)
MHPSTRKTVIGFLRAVLKRRLPFLAGSEKSLDAIYNFRAINDLYVTSGQPSEAQFQWIRDAGYQTVINLAPKSVLENAVMDEAGILAELGLKYIHQPVDFKNPTDADFERFVQAVRDEPLDRLWVHCAANMRVSAFTYRYRRDVLGVAEASAREDLFAIWAPHGVWQGFIAPRPQGSETIDGIQSHVHAQPDPDKP